MNDNEGTRNFETVQKSPESPKGNKNKPDAKKIITISIFALAIAVILLFSAVIVTEIVYSLKGDSELGDAKIKFTTLKVSDSDLHNGTLILIESKSDLDSSFDANVVDIDEYNDGDSPYGFGTNTDYPCDSLSKETIDNLNALARNLYNAKEVRLVIGFAYDKEKATGADSEHVLGTVVDLKQYADDNTNGNIHLKSTTLSWINSNAAKYGFINSTPDGHDETTQLRYVGIAHATYMSNNNCSLDKYIKEVKEHSKDDMLKISGADGKNYAVYYAEEAEKIDVPSNYKYDISGDNSNGYIITVHLSEEKE